jgi:hypothetical protein
VKKDEWPKTFHNCKSPWYWWWREQQYRADLSENNWGRKKQHVRNVIVSAFRYELARRSKRENPGQAYHEADPEIRALLAPLQIPIQPLRIGNAATRTKGTDYIKLPMLAFNKNAALGTIIKHIENVLRTECEVRKIKLPRGPKTLQTRPPSWKWLELLDRRDVLHETKFDDYDRAKIASAREESDKYREQFRKLLQELYRSDPQD